MYFDSIGELIHMGGYGAYVWGAFGITALAMILLLVNSLVVNKKTLHSIKEKQARQARVEAAKNLENTL